EHVDDGAGATDDLLEALRDRRLGRGAHRAHRLGDGRDGGDRTRRLVEERDPRGVAAVAGGELGGGAGAQAPVGTAGGRGLGARGAAVADALGAAGGEEERREAALVVAEVGEGALGGAEIAARRVELAADEASLAAGEEDLGQDARRRLRDL